MNSFRKKFYVGIFLIAASTLLLEISLVKIFSVIYYHHFAFLIVSTALFGYGLSGVFLSVSKWPQKMSSSGFIYVGSLLFTISIVVAYRLILAIPLEYEKVIGAKVQLFYLGAVYLLLALPFFFSGIAIGGMLTFFQTNISRLYFADLAGAAIGCFAIIAALPLFGGSGTVLLCGIVAAVAAIAFADRWKKLIFPVFLIALYAWMIPDSEELFPTATRSEKRHFVRSVNSVKSHYTKWSPASRIDVIKNIIWIDGGTNQSYLPRVGKGQKFEARIPEFRASPIQIPYHFIKNPKVMIIGPGGGAEVAMALGYQTTSITAVELDPLIVKLVLGELSSSIGDIYYQPGVVLINEEGRSFLRRSKEKYDIIQQRSNSHPMAVAHGALNLTETYLLTKEAFHEYLDHLEPNGFLILARHGGIRLLNLGAEVLKERGVKDYWNSMVLFKKATGRSLGNFFLLKNGRFNATELQYIRDFGKQKRRATRTPLLYMPDQMGKINTVYTALLDEKEHDRILREAPYQLEAPTDDWPFMEHLFRLRTLFSDELKRKLEDPFWQEANMARFTSGRVFSEISLYILLLEALFLSTLFIIYPLIKLRSSGVAHRGSWHLLGFFFSLGIGFIFVEIALIQQYILFIGYPVYSAVAIIFSMLLAAGLGSFYSGRISYHPVRILRLTVVFIALFIVLQILIAPVMFRHFLSAPFALRMGLSVLFIFPAGFFMGIPFPVGLSWVSGHIKPFVPWAWGINGYATVIGSVLSVIVALNSGFRTVLIAAAVIYVAGYFSFRSVAR